MLTWITEKIVELLAEIGKLGRGIGLREKIISFVFRNTGT